MEELQKTKRIKTESGSSVRVNSKDRGKIYEKWQQKSKKRIGQADTESSYNNTFNKYRNRTTKSHIFNIKIIVL